MLVFVWGPVCIMENQIQITAPERRVKTKQRVKAGTDKSRAEGRHFRLWHMAHSFLYALSSFSCIHFSPLCCGYATPHPRSQQLMGVSPICFFFLSLSHKLAISLFQDFTWNGGLYLRIFKNLSQDSQHFKVTVISRRFFTLWKSIMKTVINFQP